MATLTLQVPDSLKALAEARAAEAGFADLGQFVAQLIRGEATCAPDGMTIDSESELERILVYRAEGPFVEMDKADFDQIRDKLKKMLNQGKSNA
jgi:hypothetical protein